CVAGLPGAEPEAIAGGVIRMDLFTMAPTSSAEEFASSHIELSLAKEETAMAKVPGPGELPGVVEEFAARYPQVWEAYNRLGEAAAAAGPLDEKTQRLLKLAIAVGAQRQGAVNSHTRRALAAGCMPEELLHVAILAITTIGWPGAFAAICWIQDTL